MKKISLRKLGILSLSLILAGSFPLSCSAADNAAPDNTIVTDEITVDIPDISRDYTLLFLADMHIICQDDHISEDKKEEVSQRFNLFSTPEGDHSADRWLTLSSTLDSYNADAVLLGGDMVDFASDSNISCLKEGLENLSTPFIYVRADHDYGNWYTGLDSKYIRGLHKTIDDDLQVSVIEFPDFYAMGIDNTTSQISKKALEKIRKYFSQGKPVILMTHVPIEPQSDDTLSRQSKEVWQDRALIWGQNGGTYYEPNETTSEFLDLVYADDSPVIQVISGHLHFRWDGDLTSHSREYVVGAAYENNICLIHVQ